MELQAHASTSTLPETPTLLPYITVQHDCLAVIQDVTDGIASSESFWVSVYRGSSAVHGKVLVTAGEDDGEIGLDAQDGIILERISSTSFKIACPKLSVALTTVKFPKNTRQDLLSKGIDCMDVSPDQQRFVFGGHDGKLYVSSTIDTSSDPPLALSGHVGDVLSCRFFPSSEVILSTSSDLGIRIFSALDGSNPRVLKGHQAAVTDSAILGRGKHILTSSNDGTVKLWNVGQGECIRTWRLGVAGAKRRITCITLACRSSSDESTEELSRYFCIAATEDGTISIFAVGEPASHTPLQSISIPSPGKIINALSGVETSSDSFFLAAGTAHGTVELYHFDLSNSGQPFNTPATRCGSVRRNTADITSLTWASPASPEQSNSYRLIAATSDGLPFSLNVQLGSNNASVNISVEEELAGYDIDACNAIVSRGNAIYAAGKDGHLRKY